MSAAATPGVGTTVTGLDDLVPWRALFENSMDPMELLRPRRDSTGAITDLEIQSVNRAFLTATQRTVADLAGKGLRDAFPAIDPTIFAAFCKVADGSAPLAVEAVPLRSALHEGQVRYFDLRAVRLEDELLFATYRDVTDQVQAAERLRHSEHLYRLVSQTTSDLVLIIAQNTIIWSSPASERLLGAQPERLIGQDWRERIDPRELDAMTQFGENVLAHGHGATRVKVRRADDTLHWVSVIAGPYTDDRGSSVGLLVTLRMVDAEVEAEERTQALLRQREVILASAPVGVFRLRLLRDDVVTEYISERGLRLLSSRQGTCLAVRCMTERSVTAEDVSELWRRAEESMALGEPVVCDVEGDELHGWIRLTAYGAPDGEGNLVLDGVIEDIARARRRELDLEVKARAASERADRLERRVSLDESVISSLGHDLRTPLSTISSSASALAADGTLLTDVDQRELARGIVASADRLTHLVESLIDLRRVETGAFDVLMEPLNLLDALEVAMGQASAAVALDMPDDLPPLLADKALLERVLHNLIGNAVRHSPPHLPIVIQARHSGDLIDVLVVDHGEGVVPELYPDLFIAFRRFPGSKTGGLGLGLTIAHGFAQAMGMVLTPSPTPGGGLTMNLRVRSAHG